MVDKEEPVHLSPDRARGATKSGVTRYILAISLVAIIVLFAALLLY